MRLTGQRFLGALVAAAIIGAILWAFLPDPVPVDLALVARGPMRVTVDEDGVTRIRERYAVASPLAGRLRRIELKAGDGVKAGKTLLAVLEPGDPHLLDSRARAEAEARARAAEAAKDQAGSNLERARAAHELAATELERARQLLEAGVFPRREYDVAETAERTAAAELRAARFAGQIAAFELEQARAVLQVAPSSVPGESFPLEIRSPVNGRVLRVFQESATVVAPGAVLLELGDPADLEIVVDVLSSDGVRIRPGAKMILEHWGGDQPLLARVRLVEPAAFLKISALGVEEQRVNVIGDLLDAPNQRSALGDAYRVEARIVVWEADDVIKAPAGALFRRAGRWAVFAAKGNRARLQALETGRHNGLEAEVLAGLAVGERVILHPSDRLRDGTAIRPRAGEGK